MGIRWSRAAAASLEEATMEPSYPQQVTDLISQALRLQKDRDDAFGIIGVLVARHGGEVLITDRELTGDPPRFEVSHAPADDGIIIRIIS